MTATDTSYTRVAARVRDTLEAYARGVDRSSPDDLRATFCPDGSLTLPVGPAICGHEALHEAFTRWPVVKSCHLVSNLVVTEWNAEEAAVTSDLVVFTHVGDQGWDIQVGRYLDHLRLLDDGWRFHSRVLSFVA